MVHMSSCSVAGFTSHPDRRILGLQPGQPLHQLVLLAGGAGRDGNGQQRFGHRPRREHGRVGRIGQGVTGLRVGQPGDRHDVAGDGAADRLRPPQRPGDRAGPFVEIVLGVPGLVLRMPGEPGEMAADVHRHVGQQGAGEHPDHGDPADVRVGGRLDHLGDQRTVGAAGQRFPVAPGRGVDRRQHVLHRRREAAADHLQQLRDAEPGGRDAGSTGWKAPWATAVSRSSTTVSKPTCSPAR